MKGLNEEMMDRLFPKKALLLSYRGSITHNMYIPDTNPDSIDDVDLMGVYLAPKEFYVGLGRGKVYNKAVEKFIDKFDAVSYEFRKFVNLLLKSNPNVLGMLWLRDNHYIKINDYGKLLLNNRDIFISKLAYKTFSGYAYGQLKKMSSYSFEGYMGEKRKKLVDKFGYDCKNAAHCIRLLRMSMEYLSSGELNVFREDASQLLEIKKGFWSLEQVKNEAERLFKLNDEAFIRSKLPDKPDYNKAEELVMEILYDYINNETS